MPSTGTPSSSSFFGTLVASCAYTEAGPPDRITPARFMRAAYSRAFAGGAISHQVCASRMRRAISCEYCAPRSTIRIPRGSAVFELASRRAFSFTVLSVVANSHVLCALQAVLEILHHLHPRLVVFALLPQVDEFALRLHAFEHFERERRQ